MANAANKDDLERLAKKDRLEREIIQADLRFLIARPEFRRWIARLLKRSGQWECSFDGNNSARDFREGKRFMGLEIAREILDLDQESARTILGISLKGEYNA